MSFKYIPFLIAFIFSLLFGIIGYFTYKNGIISARHDFFENVLLNKEAGISSNNYDIINNSSFFIHEGLGETADMFILKFKDNQAISTYPVKATGKIETFKEIKHPGHITTVKDIALSEFKNSYVLRTIRFTYINNEEIAIVGQKEYKEVITDNIGSIIIPLTMPFISFGAAFILYYFYKKETKAKQDVESMLNMLNESSLVAKTDKDNKIFYINSKFCNISGYLPQELLGKNYSIFADENNPNIQNDIYNITVQHKQIWQDIINNIKKDGGLYIVKRWIKADFDASGNHVGFTSMRQDITNEVKNTERVNNQNKLMSHVAYSVRHDLRNLLTIYLPVTIKKLIKQYPKDTETLDKVYKKMRKVYDGIYEFSNLIKPNSKLNKEVANLDTIFNSYFNDTAYADKVDIKTPLDLEISSNMFCQAIDNLVRNGLKYNNSKNKLVKIYLQNGNIVVEDNGVGMSPEQFEKYSKEWVRGNSKEGSGLGLHISKLIFKAHDMKMECERSDIGTKIIIKNK